MKKNKEKRFKQDYYKERMMDKSFILNPKSQSGWIVYGPENGYNFPYPHLLRVNLKRWTYVNQDHVFFLLLLLLPRVNHGGFRRTIRPRSTTLEMQMLAYCLPICG